MCSLGVVAVLWFTFVSFHFVCSDCVTPGGNPKAKAWDKICRQPLPLESIEALVSNLLIAPMGETIVDDKSTLRLSWWLVVCTQKITVMVESEPKPQQSNHHSGCM